MILSTPFGPAWAALDASGSVTAFGFGDPHGKDRGASTELARQVDEYFAGSQTEFTLPLSPAGTPFQKVVWHELCRIPFGSVITYTELAARANASNPIALIIPCHRVLGSNGQLTGYAYGTELKRRLLEWEGRRIDSSCINP